MLLLGLDGWNPLRRLSIVKSEDRMVSAKYFSLAAAAFLVVLGLIIFHPFSAARPDGRLHVDFLDVGQGDSALVTMPDGTTLMIDGGGRTNMNRGDPDGDSDEPFQRDTRSIGEGVVAEFLCARHPPRIAF